MARKDLAGLAALGALGMMLSKGKKDADVDTSKVSDMDLTGGARSMTPDTGEIRAEDGSLSKLRRNTETGDLYSPNEPITRPTAKPKPMARPASPRIGGYMSDSEQIARANTPADTAQADRVRNLAGAFNVPLRGRRDEADNLYKKGGAVKKMASGGMASSASKRADGIATKGKTRGKMC